MALMRKGWRRIRLADTEYFWRIHGSDWGTTVTVVSPAAFVSGQRGQQLAFTLDFNNHWGRGANDTFPRPSITPRVVRFALEQALAATPPFTGEAGLRDVGLSYDAREEAYRLALPSPPGGPPSSTTRR